MPRPSPPFQHYARGETSPAAALAALLSKAYVPEAGEHVVALVCGANGDLGVLSES